jgi:MFS superfamily sulfate permease-like transporter
MGAWVDLTLMSLTFIFSIVYNVEVGVVVSLIISLLLVVHRSSKTRMTILVRYVLNGIISPSDEINLLIIGPNPWN